MRLSIAVPFIAFAGLISQAAMAQGDVQAVPLIQAPFHLPVFKNELVTVLKIDVPPHRNTGFHIHTTDSVSVNVEEANMANQLPGEKQTPPQRSKPGEPNFTAYSKQTPRIHKASNMGETPFHNVTFLFNYPEPGRFTPSTRSGVPAYKQVMDNERVRAWRLVLEPGQVAPAITQDAPGLRVVLAGSEIAELVPGQPERGMNLRLGEFYWQDAGVTRRVRNAGTTRLEMIEFELK